MKIDTFDFEASQGHAPSGDGEWGFVFADLWGYEYGRFSMVGAFEVAKATAIQIAESEFRHEVAVIKVVA
jgi:hypothetical protein